MANKDLVRLMAPRQAVSSLVSYTRDRRLLSDSLRCQSIDCRLLERLSSDCRISTGSRRRPYPSRAVLRRLSIGAVADADDGGYWRNMPGTSASQEVSSEVDYIFICRIGFDLGIVDFKVESDLTLESMVPKLNRIWLWNPGFQSRVVDSMRERTATSVGTEGDTVGAEDGGDFCRN